MSLISTALPPLAPGPTEPRCLQSPARERRSSDPAQPLHVPADSPLLWHQAPLSASSLCAEGSWASAFQAPPTASPKPGRRPQGRPRPGWAGPCGWAGGRSSTEGTALGPPAEEGTRAGGSALGHPGCGDGTGAGAGSAGG